MEPSDLHAPPGLGTESVGPIPVEAARSLSNIQQWMQAVIVHPNGIHAGAQSAANPLAPGGNSASEVTAIDDMILPSKQLTSQQRMDVYANAYYARLLECLRDEYPALELLLGEETFNAFAFDYLQFHPSQSYTLADLGQHFPAFLRDNQASARDEEAAADSSEESCPDEYWLDLMTDLALLERTYSEVFSGFGIEDKPTLSADDISSISPERISDLKLIPSPCVRLLRLNTQAHNYAIAVRKGTASNDALPQQKPTCLVITRLNYVVRTIEVEPQEYELLEHLMADVCLGEAIARVAEMSLESESLADEQDWTARISEWFQKWATDRLFLGACKFD